jgi:hypothetical protein
MSNVPEKNKYRLEPVDEGDFDLFVACGAALGKVKGTNEGFDLEALLNQQQGIVRESQEEGVQVQEGEKSHPSGSSKELATLESGKSAVRTLEAMRERKSRFLRGAGLLDCHPIILSLAAFLAAQLVLKGDEDPHCQPLPLLLPLLEPRPSAWRPILIEVTRHLAGPGALVEAVHLRDTVSLLAHKFRLTPRCISLLGLSPVEKGSAGKKKELLGSKDEADILEVSRMRGNTGLGDLVLPVEPMDEIRYITSLCKRKPRESPVLLFHGQPGTGKTHAARCMAGTLNRPLAVAKISGILDKWVGCTEKHLVEAFEGARRIGALLLLDEADSLLRSRDMARYVWEITEVNVTLRLLEDPGVPVILCTNLLPVLDPALHRRITHRIAFPLPTREDRKRIWGIELKKNRISEAFDLAALAGVPLSGGLIRNAACQAARDRTVRRRGFQMTTESLLALAKKELVKMPDEGRFREVGFVRG